MCLHPRFALGYPAVPGIVGTHLDNPMTFYLATSGSSPFPYALQRSFGSKSTKTKLGIVQTRMWSVELATHEIIEVHLIDLGNFSVTEPRNLPKHPLLLL